MADSQPTERRWRASHRFARIAPRKARAVIDLVRGLRCDAALDVLRFNRRRAAVLITDVLKSAMANANEQEAQMPRLYVAEARVDGGPIMKRWQPKDRGRAHPIQKCTSHLVIQLAERD